MEKLTNENQVLIDYNDEEDAQVNPAPLQDEKSVTTKYLEWNRYDFYRGHYAGVGGSGFQSFFLNQLPLCSRYPEPLYRKQMILKTR